MVRFDIMNKENYNQESCSRSSQACSLEKTKHDKDKIAEKGRDIQAFTLVAGTANNTRMHRTVRLRTEFTVPLELLLSLRSENVTHNPKY